MLARVHSAPGPQQRLLRDIIPMNDCVVSPATDKYGRGPLLVESECVIRKEHSIRAKICAVVPGRGV